MFRQANMRGMVFNFVILSIAFIPLSTLAGIASGETNISNVDFKFTFEPDSFTDSTGSVKTVQILGRVSNFTDSPITLNISNHKKKGSSPVTLNATQVQFHFDKAKEAYETLTVDFGHPVNGFIIHLNTTGYHVSNKHAKDSYLTVNIVHSTSLTIFNAVIGWTYFFAWSLSFYPQFWTSGKKRSVVGLDFNFVVLNWVGFFCYSVFNCAMFWNKTVQDEYLSNHPYSINPVQINDVVFALHAVVAVTFYFVMIIFFDRGDQTVSKVCIAITAVFTVFGVISLILAMTKVINWFTFITYLSYIKLAVTLLKYLPQVWLNFRRKSTIGWNIWNVLLDFTGGTLSLLQMMLIGYNYDDWSEIFGDFTKFGLGAISVIIDIIFIIQHYCLYANNNKEMLSNVPTKENLSNKYESLSDPDPEKY